MGRAEVGPSLPSPGEYGAVGIGLGFYLGWNKKMFRIGDGYLVLGYTRKGYFK